MLLLCADGQAQGEIKDRAGGFVFAGNNREILRGLAVYISPIY